LVSLSVYCLEIVLWGAPPVARSLQISSVLFEAYFLNATATPTFQAPENPLLAAALAALADLPAPEPVPAVSLLADGHWLIIGELEVALGWAERLAGNAR
jgi:hypothetical protein